MADTRVQEPPVEVYPGAPLRAVAIEVTFPALLDALPRFAAFQRRRSEEFTRLYETSEDEEDRLPDGREFDRPRCAVLMAGDRSKAVSAANDLFAVITYRYDSGHKGFLSWALPMLLEGLEDLGVRKLSRVTYRYENRIACVADALHLQEDFFKVSLPRPVEASPVVSHVHLFWQQLWPHGHVEIGIDGCPPTHKNELRLNISARHDARTASVGEIGELVLEAHRRARLAFEELVTDNFRERLRRAGT